MGSERYYLSCYIRTSDHVSSFRLIMQVSCDEFRDICLYIFEARTFRNLVVFLLDSVECAEVDLGHDTYISGDGSRTRWQYEMGSRCLLSPD